jgi:hypothetical protein
MSQPSPEDAAGTNLAPCSTIGELVGPPFLNSLAKLVGKDNLGVAGVTPYPADLPGYGIEDGSNQGGASVAKMVAQAVGCKTTQAIILAGWR